MYSNGYEYLSEEVAKNTKYKSVADAYNRDQFSIVKYNGVFWIESRGCPARTYKLVTKEVKRLYPELKHVV